MRRLIINRVSLFILFTCAGQFTYGTISCLNFYQHETVKVSRFERTSDLEMIHLFAESVAQQNLTDSYRYLEEGIRISGLGPSLIQRRLYYASRLLEISNLFLFLRKISLEGQRELVVLNGSSLEEKLAYPAKKAYIVISTFNLKSLDESFLEKTLLLTPFDVSVLAKNSTAVEALKRMKSKGLKILVSDQIDNGITQFNAHGASPHHQECKWS